MAVAFDCPKCRLPQTAPDGQAGRSAVCLSCNSMILVPAPPSPKAYVPSAAPVAPPPPQHGAWPPSPRRGGAAYFDTGRVRVTRTRVEFEHGSYAVANVTSVRWRDVPPDWGGMVGAACAAAFLATVAAMALPNAPGVAAAFGGAAVAAVVKLASVFRLHDLHVVQLCTAAGERPEYVTRVRGRAEDFAAAVEDAIADQD